MRDIVLDGPDYGSVAIKEYKGEVYVETHDPRLTASARRYYIEDKDLNRLLLALNKLKTLRDKK